MRLTLSSIAVADLERIHRFLAANDPGAADRALMQVDKGMQLLEVFPNSGRPSGIAGVRELIVPFGRAAYVVRYAYLTGRNEVVVLRVWHSREERV